VWSILRINLFALRIIVIYLLLLAFSFLRIYVKDKLGLFLLFISFLLDQKLLLLSIIISSKVSRTYWCLSFELPDLCYNLSVLKVKSLDHCFVEAALWGYRFRQLFLKSRFKFIFLLSCCIFYFIELRSKLFKRNFRFNILQNQVSFVNAGIKFFLYIENCLIVKLRNFFNYLSKLDLNTIIKLSNTISNLIFKFFTFNLSLF